MDKTSVLTKLMAVLQGAQAGIKQSLADWENLTSQAKGNKDREALVNEATSKLVKAQTDKASGRSDPTIYSGTSSIIDNLDTDEPFDPSTFVAQATVETPNSAVSLMGSLIGGDYEDGYADAKAGKPFTDTWYGGSRSLEYKQGYGRYKDEVNRTNVLLDAQMKY